MFQIRRASFDGFRGIAKGTLYFDRHSALIGGNNCGKSAIIDGIALAVGRERVVGRIDDYDFYEGFYGEVDPLSRRFVIQILFTGFDPNEVSAHPDWFNFKNGTTPIWWDDVAHNATANADDAQARDLPLAVNIGCCGFYDEDVCEYRVLRYFAGIKEFDPLLEGESLVIIPGALLRQLGVYVLPSRRVWDDALTFSASSFSRVLREQRAIPESAIHALRRAMAMAVAPEGDSNTPTEFGQIVAAVQTRLKRFNLLQRDEDQLKYRPTKLDLRGLLESLVPHVEHAGRYWTPLATQGDGVIALQNLLLLLEIGERRKGLDKGFILLMEEPELHVHPALQREIMSVARAAADQTIVTTHSPFVAAAFSPSTVQVLKKEAAIIRSERLLPNWVSDERKNLLKRYTHQERLDFLEAIMGSTVIVPEGESDADWMRWLKSLAEAESDPRLRTVQSTFTVLRTKSGQFRSSIDELRRLNADVVALADGDPAGLAHAREATDGGARIVLRWPLDWEFEDVAAAMCEPSIGLIQTLGAPFDAVVDRATLRSVLLHSKSDVRIRTEIMDAAFSVAECSAQAARLIGDISALLAGEAASSHTWRNEHGVQVLDAF